jgi:hypothetical protein
MRTTGLTLLLAVAQVSACAPPHVVTTPGPAPTAGSPVRYAARSDSTAFVGGRLVSLNADSLVVERLVAGPTRSAWITSSVPTASVARLQVRVGRRGNPGRGALIGGALGMLAGIGCANDDSGWVSPTPGECMVAGVLSGAGTGALIGLLIRSDVWAPVDVPARAGEPATALVSAVPGRIGLRIPFRLAAP